jgi:8-oxo-dGTP diphosphatase
MTNNQTENIVEKTTVFQGNFLTVKTQPSQYGVYEVVHTKTGKAAIVLTISGDHILLAQQFRVPVDNFTWELPGGTIDDGEEIVEGGIRELYEETGLIADPEKTHVFITGHPSPANLAETIYVLITHLDENEWKKPLNIQVEELSDARWFHIDDVLQMINDDNFSSYLTTAAVLKAVYQGAITSIFNK